MLSTLRACPGVEVDESEFLQVFELADNYALNGDTLMLNVGRRAPLAVLKRFIFNCIVEFEYTAKKVCAKAE